MIERTTEQRFIEDHRGGLWYTIEIEPRHIALFHAWAAHLGLSDADLAARIFTEGTIQLALDDLSGTALTVIAEENNDLADAMLVDLERHLRPPATAEGGPHGPDHP